MRKLYLILPFLLISTAFAENRQKVVVIDTGVSREQAKQPFMCKNGIWTVFKDNGLDTHGHGTNVVGLISSKMNAKKYCILSIKFWSPRQTSGESLHAFISSLKTAANLKPRFLNLSVDGTDSNLQELQQIQRIVEGKTTVIVAAGNHGVSLTRNQCLAYPACYKKHFTKALASKFYVVGAIGLKSSNYGEMVDFREKAYKVGKPEMSGTSQAAAVFTSHLVAK